MKKILVSGASGFVGKDLCKQLLKDKYQIYKLVRRTPTNENELEWDPSKMKIDKQKLKQMKPDIVINLSGESAMGYWSQKKKDEILYSRVNSTKLLATTLSKIDEGFKVPELFINASGMSYYGSNVNNRVDETSPSQVEDGLEYFTDVVKHWESETEPLKQLSRVVTMRSGIILDPSGGFLQSILLPFKLGLGGRLGSGEQIFSWIALEDMIAAIEYIITHPSIQGPVNMTSPNAVSNTQMTKELGNVLNRPTIFPVPSFLLKTLLGQEMTSQFFLSSANVYPKKLLDNGFKFKYSNLNDYFSHALK
ncbi:NAD-dependent epimerase/dehydratase family protein [Tieghemostelium lacteum]|uniref:NAD-dependent epimerase/dehydratase family protein n=1 Tax=Tieghemostelium lacteum TaxID=361077 RepID=A0A152A6R4_TIELA|nr:NAD-dependent epimerase/dehydratase family protein [Tieghemostelium lacteum]|eukprot:KYR01922.1 NAD-dependent epimerase/dehydratase family protein [Tieghemostelium lacteum]